MDENGDPLYGDVFGQAMGDDDDELVCSPAELTGSNDLVYSCLWVVPSEAWAADRMASGCTCRFIWIWLQMVACGVVCRPVEVSLALQTHSAFSKAS